MRYFPDAEFNGFGGQLISLALVPEDRAAEPFYAALSCAAPGPWTAAHVMPVLRTAPSERPRGDARRFLLPLAGEGGPAKRGRMRQPPEVPR